jgi:hypothetical protein
MPSFTVLVFVVGESAETGSIVNTWKYGTPNVMKHYVAYEHEPVHGNVIGAN